MELSNNRYSDMQKLFYQKELNIWEPTNIDCIVGSYEAHNAWPDYELLFEGIDNLKEKDVLDFGCGPGRNIIKYRDRFKSMDGADLLEGYKRLIEYKGLVEGKDYKLHVGNGYDLSTIPDSSYDIVMSTICLQHICVHDIRLNYFKEFYRVLRPNGYLTLQMGFGSPSPSTVGYYDNNWDAHGTNRMCDVCIADTKQLTDDLYPIGFSNFQYELRGPGPGDYHPNWIFFKVQKGAVE